MIQKIFIILPLVIYSLSINVYAQESFFEKLYHNTEILYTVQQTTDDGYIISGLRPPDFENRVLLMKVDVNGDTVWTRDYPGMNDSNHSRTAALETPDGGYLLAGTTDDVENRNIFLLKTDENGETIWQKTFRESLEERCWFLQQTINGGYLIGGIRYFNNKYIIKVDTSGQVEWEKELGLINPIDVRYHVTQTADSGYVIVARSNFLKIDKEGNFLWDKSFDGHYHLVKELSDKSLIIAGDNILLKTDHVGEELWQRELEILPNDFLITENEDIVLVGDKMTRLDGAGIEIQSMELDGQAQNIVQTSDGFVFCGELPDMPRYRKGWLVKTVPDGYYKSLILLHPHGRARINLRLPNDVNWRSHNIDNINIEYSQNNGNDWILLAENYPATEGNFQWIPKGLPTSDGLIRISESANPDFYDLSENPFMVHRPHDYISINDIKMYFSNHGALSHNPKTDGPGLFWPGGENGIKAAVYHDGLMWGGRVNGEIRSNGNRPKGYQQPGNIFPDGSTSNPDSTLFSIWKIRSDWGVFPPGPARDRLEYDYYNWPVQIGAPWTDHDLDGIYDPEIDQPKLYGDETNWFVMNDMDTNYWNAWLYNSDPIGLEIQCTIYGYNRENVLRDVLFIKHQIINKGQNIVEDMYLGYWSDPDLGDARDDFVGCDTLLDLGYCYNGDNEDGDGSWEWFYGTPPPAVGCILLQGPIIPASPTDIAYFKDKWITGYKNIDMKTFYLYIPGFPGIGHPFETPQNHPVGAEELYNNFQGLHWNGNPIIDPNSGKSTIYPLAGDPVSGTGWYEGDGWPEGPETSNRLMQLNTGPFTLSPGDTQEIVVAIVLAQGEDHLDSVTKLKEKAAAVRQFYYTGTLTGIGDRASSQPTSFRLEQNYPNPFNPITAIGYRLPAVSKVDLSIYNVLGQKVVTLVSEKQKAGYHQVEWDASRFATGVYFYILRAGDFRDVKKMVLLK